MRHNAVERARQAVWLRSCGWRCVSAVGGRSLWRSPDRLDPVAVYTLGVATQRQRDRERGHTATRADHQVDQARIEAASDDLHQLLARADPDLVDLLTEPA